MKSEKTKLRGNDPNLGKKKAPRGFRTIQVNDREYFWIANESRITIRSDSGRRYSTRNNYMPLTPYDIRETILANQDKLT